MSIARQSPAGTSGGIFRGGGGTGIGARPVRRR